MYRFKRFAVRPPIGVLVACVLLSVRGVNVAAAKDCDRSPVTFSGGEFARAIAFFVGDPTALNSNVIIDNAEFTFGPPRSLLTVEHQVVDMSIHMDFDSSRVIDQWARAVQGQADVGCSSRTVWFPSPSWSVDATGAWVGRFHIKQVVRTCFHIPFDGDAQIDGATYEVDFWNRVGIMVSADRRSIVPVPTNGQSDNVSPLVKSIAQGLGAIAQIVTIGLVPQQDIQAIDGRKDEEKAIQFMEQYEQGILNKTNAAGPKDYAGFTFDFLFSKAAFINQGGRLLLSLDSSQTDANLPSLTEACTIREALYDMKIGGKMVGPTGVDYVTVAGDSFWKIAQKFYGNEKFYMLVAGQNGVGTSRMNHLVVGRRIRLDSMASLRKRDDLTLVMKRDNLWRIAERQTGINFDTLRINNRGWLANPNKIYPMQFIRRQAMPQKVASSRKTGT